MSILIKGMEMPKDGSWRSIRIYPDGTIGRPIGFGDYALVEGAKAVPAADVRPVVLCRDCKNADYSGMGSGCVWCNEMERAMRETDFCSRGAKMEDGDVRERET